MARRLLYSDILAISRARILISYYYLILIFIPRPDLEDLAPRMTEFPGFHPKITILEHIPF